MTSARILQADCREVLAGMAAGSVDAVVTDPPWNLGKRYGTHDDRMPPGRYVAWLASVLADCARVSRGPVVLLPGACNEALVPALLRAAGVREAARLEWRKPAREPVLWLGDHAPPADLARVLVADEPPAGDPRMAGHPCPKPVSLLRTLVRAAAPAGGRVLDPFAGTGTTLVAATAEGRSALGFELEARYCAVARERLRAK